jgi:hypothetical protein
MKAVCNSDDFLTYVDRWVDFGTWAQPDPCAPADYSDTLNGDFNADTAQGSHYGKTYGPDPLHLGDCIRDTNPVDGTGRFPTLHGTNKDQGGYSSSFANAMWAAYRPTITAIRQPAAPLRLSEKDIISVRRNPSGPACGMLMITYTLPVRQQVAVGLYDMHGHRINELVNSIKEQGQHNVMWNGHDASGQIVPSGIYYLVMITDTKQVVKRVTLVK